MGRIIASEPPLQVFVSSVMGDPLLDTARGLAKQAIGAAPFLHPWLFEFTPASSEGPRTTYLKRVANADLVIWLVGAETSRPVEDEIATALDNKVPLLVFKLPVQERTDGTEALLDRVAQHCKWVTVDDLASLGQIIRLTLQDEIVRAVRRRTATSPSRLPYLETVGRQSRGRCIARWQGAGIPSASATDFADDPDLGVPSQLVADRRGLVLLVGPMGSGKSLTAERLLQRAITNALDDDAAPLPVYVEAGQIQDGLEGTISEVAGPLSWNHDRGVWLVVDGLESLGSERAVEVIEQARAYCHTFAATTICVTSRPIPTMARFEECIQLTPLSVEESLELINLVGDTQLSTYSISEWPESLREAVKRPLFAILAGSFIRAVGRPPSNVVSLIDEVINTALGRPGHQDDGLDALPTLAAKSIEHGVGPIHAAEAGLTPDTRFALARAGLIVDSGRALQFSIPLFAQWFAAQWLLEGNRAPIEELRDAEAWSTSLSIAIGKGSFDGTYDQMDELVTRYPGLAGEVIDDALSRWGDERDISEVQPSKRELGRVPTTMVSWITGLGDLGRLIGPLTRQGLCPFAAQMYGSRLSTSWYFGEDEVGSEVPPEAFQGQWPWGLVLSSPVGSGSNWPWRWSLETLKLSLANIMSTRSLPTSGTFIEKEAAWRTALELIGRGSLYSEPIDLQLLDEEVLERAEAAELNAVRRRRLRIPELRRVVGQLQASGAQTMDPPLPGPDLRHSGGWVWSPYSEQRLRERTIAVYEAALHAFTEIVDQWFSNLRHVMPRALMMPVSMRGRLTMPNNKGGMGPVLNYYWEPIDDSQASVVDLTADVPSVVGGDPPESIFTAIRRFRPEFAHRLSPSGALTVLDIFDADPVTRLVYQWLWEDLSSAGWLSGPAPREEAGNIVGAKFAGMQVVRVEDGEG